MHPDCSSPSELDNAAENFLDWPEEDEDEDWGWDNRQESTTSMTIRAAPAISFGLSIDAVLKPARSDQRRVTWLKTNPGAQLLSGSFHPVPPEGWAAECHLPPGAHKFNRIVLVGGNATRSSTLPYNDPERQVLSLCRRRFLRALLVAYPTINDVLGYGNKFTNPSSTVAEWRDGHHDYWRYRGKCPKLFITI